MSRNPYIRQISKTTWYFKNARYLRYMSREITCLFIGAFGLLMVCTLERLSEGQLAYESFLASLRGPWSTFWLLLIFIFAVHNSTSWFNVTPKALPVQIGEEFLQGKYIILAHYALWALVSLVVLFMSGVMQ